jgi:putative oxygen-independent coproporphyrinogen III oxidase
MDAIALYIHIPFCRAKCAYCDFNSYAGLEDLFGAYTAALAREIEQVGPAWVRTIFVGGGTPTVLPLPRLAQVLDASRRAFTVDPDLEISIEANPGTVDDRTLSGLRALGINRLSLGVQSLDDAELLLLGRIHTAAEAVEAFRAARQAGFENLNLDLIYGLPGQTMAAWQETLERALALEPDHLSLYALGVEEGTPLASAIAQGVLPDPDPDLAAEMYEWAEDNLAAAGCLHYEISNWAREPGFECRHNLTYWRNEPSRGIGAGAHSWVGGRRWANVAHPAEYTARLLGGGCPVEAEEEIGPALEMGETMMMGLRLLDEGVPFERFRARFGEDLRQRFTGELMELADLGLIAIDDQRIRLSRRGRLVGNQVFLRFLPG